MRSLRTQGRSYVEIEREADRFRGRLGLGVEAPIPPGISLFESLGRQVVSVAGAPIPLAYDVEDLPVGVLALTRFEAQSGEIVVYLAEGTYAALEHGQHRARFTLCHELGHVVLHGHELILRSQVPHVQRGDFLREERRRPYLDPEWQANAFSAAMLLPARALAQLECEDRILNPLLMQVYFGVSADCANLRLKTYYERGSELLRAVHADN